MTPIQNIIWCFEKIKSKCTLLTKFTQHLHWKSKREVQGRVSVENEVTEKKKQIGHRWVLKEEDGKRKMWRIMKSKSWRRGDSNFILQSYWAFFFHSSLSFCWVFLAYSNLHHPALKKLTKLPHKKKKKKKINHFMFRPVSIYGLKQPNFAYTGSIFSWTKQGGYLYWFTGRYGIYRQYWLVWYEIDFLDTSALITYNESSSFIVCLKFLFIYLDFSLFCSCTFFLTLTLLSWFIL